MRSMGSSSVVVAIIDDGFDLIHPDLADVGKIVNPWDFIRNSPDPSPNYNDWHGTACAGVALGSANGIGILGAAPNSRLMPIRWGRWLSDESVERWFDYAREQGASVLSCSWGAAANVYVLSERQKRAIRRCAEEGRDNLGTVICFAAGNDNLDIEATDKSSHYGFANHPNVIAVSAINSMDKKSNYSNYGKNISVCAPSSGRVGITTSDVTGTFVFNDNTQAYAGYGPGDYYHEFGGTSSACPLVAGICALILSIDPSMHAKDVKDLIERTARKVGNLQDYDANGHSTIYGYGCIDAEKAVEELLESINTPMISIDQINKIPLHYARTDEHPYGTIGYRSSFYVEKDLNKTLKSCFRELFKACPLGTPKAITTAGIQVNKPGQHGPGRAFDLDAIFWEDYTFVTNNFRQDPILYLGIESYLRKHFGVVLNYFYNNSHKDHWHMDKSAALTFDKTSRSKVLYVQLTLNYIYNIPVFIDGEWGPQTAGAVAEAFQMLNINGEITTKKYWFKYLELSGTIAFRLFEQDKNPRALIDNLYAMLRDADFPQKNSVLESLNNFLNHDQTEKWFASIATEKDLPAIIEDVTAIV